MAYGEFVPGIHSVVVDPRNPDHLLVGVSIAGVLGTTDGGTTWHGRNTGMLNDYLPNPAAEWGHDPHFVAESAGAPEFVWHRHDVCQTFSDRSVKMTIDI